MIKTLSAVVAVTVSGAAFAVPPVGPIDTLGKPIALTFLYTGTQNVAVNTNQAPTFAFQSGGGVADDDGTSFIEFDIGSTVAPCAATGGVLCPPPTPAAQGNHDVDFPYRFAGPVSRTSAKSFIRNGNSLPAWKLLGDPSTGFVHIWSVDHVAFA